MAVDAGSGLVGRERELALLRSALAGGPVVVVVEGEAGVGKTRLVQEVLAAPAAAGRVMVAACPPLREPFTLGPIVDALRIEAPRVAGLSLSPLAGALRPLFPDWADDLPPTPEPLDDLRAAQHRVFRALLELLRGLETVVLVVEDVHWADDATAEFLLFLAAQPVRQVSVVVTYRPEDVPAQSLLRQLSGRYAQARYVLEPLSPAATAELVSSILDGDRVSPDFAAFLHQHTAGLPLEVEELVRLMRERADLVRFDDEWRRRRLTRISVPPTVRDTVLERAGRRSAAARRLLDAAAVLDTPSPAAEILAVADVPASRADRALAECLRSGLLQEDARGRLACRHALAARAIHESIPTAARQALHRRAARRLERPDPPPLARLAHHFRAAGDTDQWCHYAELAADHALASSDDATAATLLYGVVVEAVPAATTMARLIRKLPFTGFTGPQRFQELLAAMRTALRRDLLSPAEEAGLRYLLGRILGAMEVDYRAARIEIRRALPHLPPDSPDALYAMTWLAQPRGPESGAAHRYWARRAAQIPAGTPDGDRLRIAIQRVSAVLNLGEQAGWAEAARLLAQTRTPALRSRRAMLQLHLSGGAMLWGRYRVARRLLMAVSRQAEWDSHPRVRQFVSGNQAHLDYLTGNWTGLPERITVLAGDPDLQPVSRLEATLVEGLLAAATGRGAAERTLREVWDEATRRGAADQLPAPGPAPALAWLYLADGRAAEAVAMLDHPLRMVEYKQVWVRGTDLVPAGVESLIAIGRMAEAARLVTAFEEGLRSIPAPGPWAGLALARAIVAEGRGELVEAVQRFERAALAWGALPRPYDAALAEERQARCLVATGQVAAGQALLRRTHQRLSELGAAPAADRVAAQLAALPAARRSAGRPSYGNRLSPRELEVVRLLVEGRTNREIAKILTVSPRTTASHVESAMRKLDVPSRTALAVRVVELGIVGAGRGSI